MYEIFRCGMVHEYAVKRACTIFMVKGAETCGIGTDTSGCYYFVVERYFEDLMRAAQQLHSELQTKPFLPK